MCIRLPLTGSNIRCSTTFIIVGISVHNFLHTDIPEASYILYNALCTTTSGYSAFTKSGVIEITPARILDLGKEKWRISWNFPTIVENR